MQTDIVELYKKGVRLTPEAYDFIENNKIEPEVIEKISKLDSPIINLETIEKLISIQEKVPTQAVISRSPDFKPLAKEYDSNVRLISKSDVSGKTNCTGKLEDFVNYFRNRFQRISKILKTRNSPYPMITTSQVKEVIDAKVRLIGMVTDKRITKKGNILFDVEDEEGNAKVVINKDTDAFKAAQRMLLDDIVAFDGKSIGELFISDSITWPDLPFAREQKKAENDLAIAYLSDLHFGSKKFLDKEFFRFINWLNGAEGKKELAGKIKYIVICGDVVDGIGIYPEQEKELAVKDIYQQYELVDKALEYIPDYIEVIVAPGNHDAVRRAEPQPIIPYDLLKTDVIRTSNPATVEIEGLRHLIYHGTSLDSIIASLSGLTYSKPEEAMMELVKRRHLSPIYGDNLIVPEGTDYLVIEEEPDVVHMGHVHKNGLMLYRGALLINSGTFQDRTEYQVKLGHVPTPCVVPILETKSGRVHHISFRES
ncbi:MAG: DNA-directed DNA polymerase II small subunit [Candidatus Micrarchaeota archaeon]|nr:DNA-directed DNA polymerase II small subunit [Candidatus Micrarchaeota archaeon]